MKNTKRVSVTITTEMDEYFTDLAEKLSISKDKVIGQILIPAYEKHVSGIKPGRKDLFSNEDKHIMKSLYADGFSMRGLAKKFNCSVGTVHKIINEHIE
ncbi:helix-turn-helix domain-containing protein [Niameybacter massiliensis]|uniref:Helix-turn-helix domain-containing protein n=1 Tax=Holtiella tumoricola TaxID=3018743 RepID=A0AA42DJ47_9FIRM|nr:helix-turn-helix domain-containing protein [Holtiella tumoricola]MDA3729895.1 helix-turn-helix domain-containing protein [Holtiella tumoricola]